jgi:hypothetical protein
VQEARVYPDQMEGYASAFHALIVKGFRPFLKKCKRLLMHPQLVFTKDQHGPT